MNKREIGDSYEELAAKFVESRGCTVIERNFYSRYGEIDLIFKDGDYLVLGEVKYRKSTVSGHPEEAVNFSKQRKLIKTAEYFLYKNSRYCDCPIRFDVLSITGDKIKWIKNAFNL